MFDQVAALIPFDSGVWATGIHATNHIHSAHLFNQQPELMMRYSMDYVETDLVRARAIAEPGLAFRIEDVMTLETWRSLPAYTKFGRDFGIEHAMGTAQNDPGSGVSELILLWRADRDRPFTDAERLIKQSLVPHMIGAWRHRQIIGAIKSSVGYDDSQIHEGRAHSIVDNHGMIFAVVGNFAAQLATAVPHWVGPKLPDVILSAMQSQSMKTVVGGHEFIFFRADQRTIVTSTPQTSLLKLSPGEMRTALLVAGGATHSAAAVSLGLSVFTVRNQMTSAYRKLGVHSKIGLAEAIKNRL